MVNRGTPETRYEILPGHSVHIKQSPINGNSHITKEHKSLGGLKTDFNFEVKQKVIYRSQHSLHLKMKWINSKTQRYPEYEKITS